MLYTRETLIKLLGEISKLEGHQFKSRAYRNACDQLEYMSDKEFNERNNFIDIPGIGCGINDKIIEFKSTGVIQKLLELRSENREFLSQDQYKIRKSYITKRSEIDSYEVRMLVNKLEEIFKEANVLIKYFCGSYRRKAKLIADIDILLIYPIDKESVEKILFEDSMFTCMCSGYTKSSWRYESDSKLAVDINLGDSKCVPFELLHHTGSVATNIKMRAEAKRQGYLLNQYGIFPIDKNNLEATKRLEDFEFNLESDIFKFLGLPYVKPEDR